MKLSFILLFCVLSVYSKTFLYFHGGPGGNSLPEQNLLAEKFKGKGHKIVFWNEISKVRDEGYKFTKEYAFKKNLHSAREFLLKNHHDDEVYLIGHSFGAHYVLDLARQFPQFVAANLLIGPVLDTTQTDKLIVEFNLNTLDKDSEAHKAMEKVAANYDEELEKSRAMIYQTAFTNPAFVPAYFNSPDKLQAYFAYLTGAYAFDLEVLVDVRASINPAFYRRRPTTVPTLALFGSKDHVSQIDSQRYVLESQFADIEMREVLNQKHFYHLEDFDGFYSEVSNFIAY